MSRVTGEDLGRRIVSRFTLRERTRELRPRDAAYLVIAVWLLAVVAWGTAEHFLDKETFPTVWLGMWWALQTVTTVGYGDVVPSHGLGRGVASLLLLGGLAFISVITATITSGFVALRERQARKRAVCVARLPAARALRSRLSGAPACVRGDGRFADGRCASAIAPRQARSPIGGGPRRQAGALPGEYVRARRSPPARAPPTRRR